MVTPPCIRYKSHMLRGDLRLPPFILRSVFHHSPSYGFKILTLFFNICRMLEVLGMDRERQEVGLVFVRVCHCLKIRSQARILLSLSFCIESTLPLISYLI